MAAANESNATTPSRQKMQQPSSPSKRRVSFELLNIDARPPSPSPPALTNSSDMQQNDVAGSSQDGDDGYKEFLRILAPTPPTMPSSDEDESDGNVPPPPAAPSSSDQQQQDDAGQVADDGHGELITLN